MYDNIYEISYARHEMKYLEIRDIFVLLHRI